MCCSPSLQQAVAVNYLEIAASGLARQACSELGTVNGARS
jgi:hypothetical protein